ncbi:MAG: RND transporter [Candidatus Electrothrix sp. Rat3]|nr:RND transporter [Candidatus Electrothrix rattekaaiensis]
MEKIWKWLDALPFAPLVVVALILGFAPFVPEPHLVEKIRMLAAGTLVRPIDIFDLFYHGLPLALLFLKLIRLLNRTDKA